MTAGKRKEKDVQSNVEKCRGGEREGGGKGWTSGLGGEVVGRDCRRMYYLQRWRRKEREGASASQALEKRGILPSAWVD